MGGLKMTCDRYKDIYTADSSTAKDKAGSRFFTEIPGAGQAFIYTMDRAGSYGHAMAVSGIVQKGSKFILTIFNQSRKPHRDWRLYLSKWEVNPAKESCKCIENCSRKKGTECSTIYRYRIHN